MLGSRNTRGWRPSKFALCAHVYVTPSADLLSEIEHIWQKSWRMGFYRGGPVFMSALAGIDIALWDLKGLSTHTTFQSKAKSDTRFSQKT